VKAPFEGQIADRKRYLADRDGLPSEHLGDFAPDHHLMMSSRVTSEAKCSPRTAVAK